MVENGIVTDSEMEENPREAEEERQNSKKKISKAGIYGSRRSGQDSDDDANDSD